VEQHADDREGGGDGAGRPGQPERLSIPISSRGPGEKAPPTVVRTMPVTLVITTSRQRRERRWPLGSSRAGRVTPSAIAGAQLRSPVAATTWATSGNGRCSRTSWSIQGATGTLYAHASPAAPYSQPIGFSGRRRASTSPTVANPSTTKNA
jgi:hypothetical protein